MRDVRISLIALIAVVALVTLFVRIPLPSRGYFNIGDVAVVFAGLVLGHLAPKTGFMWGAAAGGIGSALADIVGGFAVFAPITLVAKGMEGGLAGLASGREGPLHYVLLALAGVSIVVVYFVAEALLPSIGLQGAVAELPANVAQAVAGAVVGRLAFAAYLRITEGNSSETA